MNIEEFANINHRFADYRDGVRVIMLIDRGIKNTNKGSRRWINKIITTNPDEWMNAVERLGDLQDHIGDPDIRMYASLNQRHMSKAIKTFKYAQLDLQDHEILRFYAKINNTFCSCLMQPENRATKWFLLDIDSHDTLEVDRFISDRLIKVNHTYPTPHGWHYIVDPFDATWAGGYKTFTLIKDGLLLLRTIEDKDNDKEPEISERDDTARTES